MTKVILGGGLTGLSAAYYLLKRIPNQKVTLVESSHRLGGWIKSNVLDNEVIFEQGPRTIRPQGKPGANTLSLIDDLGLSSKITPILASHPAAQNRMIYVNGKLFTLPSGLFSLFKKQPPFSKSFIRYFAQDFFSPKKTVSDESIYDFACRRFGQEFADYLISALICGICAGNSKEISVKFLMKQFFEYEQRYGSVLKGVANNLFKRKENVELKGLALRAKKEKWSVYSFINGLETLPQSLENYIRRNNVDIQLNSRCNQLEMSDNGLILHFENGAHLKSDHLISSIPAESLAKLTERQHPHFSKLLTNIPSVSVCVVNLCYPGKLLTREGFGFLVPPKEQLPILGIIYDSCCFSRSNDTVLTVMMGGYWFEQFFGKNPEENVLLQTAKEQVKAILGIRQEPAQFKVNILHKCIPQYVVGHEDNLNGINRYINENKLPISLCGASFYGVGVNDVILSARNAVECL
ncbi:hypothetical protein NQ317_000440 [Molorchus minor]|uniref:Protoporphyrinogen oxidase n=1 Tax=Molorchus minor TaxID=1323400 RepID=A0ABQ9J6G9_9CUCU|nr:hypothetical protein NQ317_000440 [Molorchus minor]